MKKIALLLVAMLSLALTFISCAYRDDEKFDDVDRSYFLGIGATEVIKNIFDDGFSSAYIVATSRGKGDNDKAVAGLILQKRTFEKSFPQKRIVSSSVVVGDWGGGQPIVIGLLIHYEYSRL